jgi:DNA polymerase-1
VEGKEEDGTDVHSINTRALGMDPKKVYTISGKDQTGRNCAKTFIYAFLYGAGDEKIAKTVGLRTESRGAGSRSRFLDSASGSKEAA